MHVASHGVHVVSHGHMHIMVYCNNSITSKPQCTVPVWCVHVMNSATQRTTHHLSRQSCSRCVHVPPFADCGTINDAILLLLLSAASLLCRRAVTLSQGRRRLVCWFCLVCSCVCASVLLDTAKCIHYCGRAN